MEYNTTKPIVAVWVSCGAASAVAACLTVRDYGKTHDVRLVNSPIMEEHPDNQRFLRDLSLHIGVPIESATAKQYPSARCRDVWERRNYMSGHLGAPCTMILKKWARQQWEERNNPNHHVLGFTLDEQARHDRFVKTERDNVLPVLINAKMTKAHCHAYVNQIGLRLPAMYDLGYPNANCIGCVKSNSPTYWNHVRDTFPEVFKDRAEQSRRIGAKLVRVKGKRKFLDDLSPDEMGRPLSTVTMPECGLFCEEPVALTPPTHGDKNG